MTIAADTRQAPRAEPQQPSLLRSAQALLRELPGLLGDRIKLLALELRRAGVALAQILALAVAAALLLITAWLAIWIGLAAAVIQAGLPWGWALLLVLVLNLGAAFLALQRARSLLALLGVPATVRRLSITPAPETSSPPASSHERAAQQHAP